MPRYPASVLSTALIALLTGLLAACTSETPDPGLIRAPGFADESGRLASSWRFAHHASTDSYRLTIEEGVATIERVGPEPWSQLTQPVPAESIDSLAGRRMAFSVDVRAELENETFGPPLEPTALAVRIWRKRSSGSGLNAMLGGGTPHVERLVLPENGVADWQRFTLEFTMPENPARMEVSAVMASGGWLSLRNPALNPVEP